MQRHGISKTDKKYFSGKENLQEVLIMKVGDIILLF